LFLSVAFVMMERMPEHGGGTSESSCDGVPRSRLSEYAETTVPEVVPQVSTAADAAAEVAARKREFAVLLGEFRRSAVLVPLEEGPGPDGERGVLTADLNGVRFILAFSDESALARYAVARGGAGREWVYRTVLGARLLDVAVPAAGVPCGVALDCADGPEGMVFPPVRGIVPDAVAVDAGDDDGDGTGAVA
jgi:hypothetical protein